MSICGSLLNSKKVIQFLIALTAFWVVPAPAATSASEDTFVNLTELKPINGVDRAGRNPFDRVVHVNQTDTNKPLVLAGRNVSDGLFFSESRISIDYALDQSFSGFTGRVGLHDDNKRIRPVLFKVLADGEVAFSTQISDSETVVPVVVDVSATEKLSLVVAVPPGEQAGAISGLILADPRLIAVPEPGKKVVATGKMQAAIAASPTSGDAPLKVSFDARDSQAPDGVGRYSWWFGDGAIEALRPAPTHTYTEPGVYEVLLEITDEAGRLARERRAITVRAPGNRPPEPAISVSGAMIQPGGRIRFDASASGDRDGSITSWKWHFSDGEQASGPVVERSFQKTGSVTATLTVTDDEGATATEQRMIRVDDGSFSSVLPLREGSRVLFIGNSLTGFHGPLPAALQALTGASRSPFQIEVDQVGKGIGVLVEYATWPSLGVREKIAEGWDVVVIQAYKDAIPGDSPESEALEESLATLVSWCREYAAYPVLWMPHLHWHSWTFHAPAAAQRSEAVAGKLDVAFVQSYPAWNHVFEAHSQPVDERGVLEKSDDPSHFQNILFADTVHQNGNGMLLNAAILYKALTGQSPVGLRPDWPRAMTAGRVRFDPERQDEFFEIVNDTTPALSPTSKRY